VTKEAVRSQSAQPGLAQDLQVIVNPTAGAGRTARRWPRLRAELAALGLRCTSYFTEGPGWATRKVRELLRAGAREIAVVGGDGTVNEVANGFFENDRPVASDAVLSVLPSGTGHDFARSIGLPSLRAAVQALLDGRIRVIDVGAAVFQNGGERRARYFVNAADVGLGAAAAARVNRSRKLIGGLLTYVAGAVGSLLSFRAQTVRVTVDGDPLLHEASDMVLVANGRFHAGGMRMAPAADMSDGLLEVFALRHVPRWRLVLEILPRAALGRHVGHPALCYRRGREVQISADSPLLFEMDGEQPGTTDVQVRLVPRALRVRTLAEPSANQD
jgi:YegS/Rv2252/BmrU family lipid kinase